MCSEGPAYGRRNQFKVAARHPAFARFGLHKMPVFRESASLGFYMCDNAINAGVENPNRSSDRKAFWLFDFGHALKYAIQRAETHK